MRSESAFFQRALRGIDGTAGISDGFHDLKTPPPAGLNSIRDGGGDERQTRYAVYVSFLHRYVRSVSDLGLFSANEHIAH
jgi:hypothetical protein